MYLEPAPRARFARRQREVGVVFVMALAVLVAACRPRSDAGVNLTEVAREGDIRVRADFWADNWFQFYLGDDLIVEDSVSIETERSFNAESVLFSADYPFQLNLVLKDFRENDTGLEYIGARNQQMGDGGFIAQLFDASTEQLIVASDAQWKCFVVHEAPLDVSCEGESKPVAGEGPCGFIETDEPLGWKQAEFDDSSWPFATEHSADSVRPKGGFDQIDWHSGAHLIWTSDLERHNTVLCRATVSGPTETAMHPRVRPTKRSTEQLDLR